MSADGMPPHDRYESTRRHPAAVPGPGASDPLAAVTDETIADRTATALERDPRVYGRGLGILVQNGVVILLGDVSSHEVSAAAWLRTWTVPGVRDVCNRLTVSDAPGSEP